MDQVYYSQNIFAKESSQPVAPSGKGKKKTVKREADAPTRKKKFTQDEIKVMVRECNNLISTMLISGRLSASLTNRKKHDTWLISQRISSQCTRN